MSRIFEALQRSESEKSGSAVPLESVLATELLESVERDAPEPVRVDQPPADTQQVGQFRSVPVAIAPESRLVSLFDKESLAAEKFRFLGVRLRQLQQARSLKKLLITSTLPEEGKSLVSANRTSPESQNGCRRVPARLTAFTTWMAQDSGFCLREDPPRTRLN